MAEMTANMDRLVGINGTLVKLAEEARQTIRARASNRKKEGQPPGQLPLNNVSVGFFRT